MINFVTFLSTSMLTGSQYAYGIKMRYLTPIPFEKELIEKNMKSIKSYHEILN